LLSVNLRTRAHTCAPSANEKPAGRSDRSNWPCVYREGNPIRRRHFASLWRSAPILSLCPDDDRHPADPPKLNHIIKTKKHSRVVQW
jgi:hypothetical protein